MDFRTTLRAIRIIGLGNVMRTLRYTLQRDRLARRYAPATAGAVQQPPGELHQAQPTTRGANFHFANMQLEIAFLAPDLVRITWQPGDLPIPYAIARSKWPPVETEMLKRDEHWEVMSKTLSLRVHPDGSLGFFDIQGKPLRQESPPIRQAETWTHWAGLRPEEHIYGLGERASSLNLRPGSYRMWNRDPGGDYGPGADPLYVCIPAYVGLHDQGSYLVYFENSYDATFIFHSMAETRFPDGALRYYLIQGPPDHALARYAELTGRPPLPPRWSLGYHQSRWGYRSSEEIRNLVAGFHSHDLPLSAIHLDLHYMEGYRVFTISGERFPDMKALADELKDQGVRLVTIIDPGIKADPGYFLYQDALDKDVLCKLPNGKTVRAPVWPGWCVFPDFTDPAARAWWGEQYPRLLDQGVVGVWHDMNEPSGFVAYGEPTLPSPTRHSLEGSQGDHRQAHNLYGLLMNRAGYEALTKLQPDRRPFILSRSGTAGSQRYAWNWTGDTASTWQTLRQTIATVLGLGLSGIPYTGPDIGGFSGAPSAELYLRWFQAAAFMPFFRTHSSILTPRREPWTFGQPYLGILRKFLRLRYQLLPYLYALAWQASQTGLPLVRPLFWNQPQDARLWGVDDCFLLGEDLLVAPVLEEGARSRQVVLPGGGWYSFWDDALFQGSGTVECKAPLDRIPLLVRQGSVFPTEEGQALTLHLYPPGEAPGRGLLYSDQGDGHGPSRLDRFSLRRANDDLELLWKDEGDFAFPYASISVQLHAAAAKRAMVDGKEMSVSDNRLLLSSPFKRLLLKA
ncbi:MAG: glycoside hydrolase family 31 protein [Anaerolineales bacterium]|jgi:alpha-glucosidase